MKLQPSLSSEQARGLHYSIGHASYVPLRTLATDSFGKKASTNKVLIAIVAFLTVSSLLIPSASAQTYLTSTQLYRPGTQLNPNLGICLRSTSDPSMAEVVADGFTWIRIGAVWYQNNQGTISGIETVKGQYDWTAFDAICQQCLKYHLKPHWLLYYGNPLYFDAGNGNNGNACSSTGIAAFANYAAACAKESVAQGIPGAHYEIWNEPENYGWLGILYNQPNANILSNSQVAQINNASVGPIHAADPTALVCTSSYGSLNTEYYPGQLAFAGSPQANPPVSGMDSNGAFDAIALHQYSLGQAYDSTEGTNGDDNPECLMAYNSANLSADLYPNVTQAIIPQYVPGTKNYWVTEAGRQYDYDCASTPNYFSYEWVRTTLCQWMAGIQWQALYCFDGETEYNLQGNTQAEKAMTFLTTKTRGRSIATMSYPSFSGSLPPANDIWSVTLTGSPTIQAVWVPEGSASVPVPAGWTATDMYGNNLNSQITNSTLPMQESSGVYYLTNAIVESSTLKLSPANIALDNLAANATVTATCTLKNNSASSVTLNPDIAARDPNGNNFDFGSGNVGTTTLAPGSTLSISASKAFTASSLIGNYPVFMAYSVNGTYYNLAPILTLPVKQNSVAESSTLKLSKSSITLSSASPSATVTATCTLKNNSAASITLNPDIAARDPNGNNTDFGSNVGTTTLAPGQTLPISINKTFTTSSSAGNYAVFMAYSVNGTYYNLAPTLTLTVKQSP